MTNLKNTKRALISSILILCMCFSMLLGTTFAWFTDDVTAANNVIQTGTLKVGMYWADGTKAVPAEEGWTDASTGSIFNNDKWEPGYVEVRHIKIANEGTLALKYKVNIIANGEVSELADVIDVYYIDPAIQVVDRAALANAPKLGTLTDVLENLGNTGNGALEAGKSDTITIALMMQESAGNEYMDLSIGTDFSIQILATQYTYEADSFDNQYDDDASYQVIVNSAAELHSAIDNANPGDEIILNANIASDEPFVISGSASTTYSLRSTPAPIVIDLNGNTITGHANNCTIKVVGANVVIKDTSADNSGKIVQTDEFDGIGLFEGAKLEFVSGTIEAPRYGIYVRPDCELTFSSGTINAGGIGIAVNNALATTVNGGDISAPNALYVWSCTTLNVSGGEFHGYIGSLPGSVTGGTFYDGIAASFIAEGSEVWEFWKSDKRVSLVYKTPSVSLETLIANAGENDTINVPAGIYTFNASGLKAGQTLQCAPGTIFKGESNLNVNGATVIGATFSNPSSNVVVGLDKTVNGTFKNCTFEGGSTIYNCIPGDTVVFEDCTFNSDGAYSIHFADVTNKDISFVNCNIIGWVAFAEGANSITFDGCNFKDNGRLGGIRFYDDATLKNCTFDYSNTIDRANYGIQVEENAKVTIDKCINNNGDIVDIRYEFYVAEDDTIVIK